MYAERTARRERLQCRCARYGVGTVDRSIPYLLARHLRGVGEECECTRQERGVEYIHTRTAEDLLAEYDGEGRSQSHDPQRYVDGHNHRDQKTRNEKSLVDLVAARLREAELYGKTDDIRDDDQRQHFQKTEPERLEARHADLISDIVHAEQQGRNKSHNDHDHRSLHIVAVADMSTLGRGGIRHEEERFERIECRAEEAQLTPFGESRLHFIYQITQSHSLTLLNH